MGNSTLIRTIAALGVSAVTCMAAAVPAQAEPLTGQSGGPQSSDCGYVSEVPVHTVEITESLAPLNIQVSSSGSYSLMIESDGGFSECVRAHSYDGGTIESTGSAPQGTYRIYVGDFEGGSHPFTLTVDE
ncbi:MAG: hypothetical protein AAFZ80_09385 [Cyanobacteria bacterium P01_A01_bin.105]